VGGDEVLENAPRALLKSREWWMRGGWRRGTRKRTPGSVEEPGVVDARGAGEVGGGGKRAGGGDERALLMDGRARVVVV
jgi:hypothetical protein